MGNGLCILSTPSHKYGDVCWERDECQIEARRRVDAGPSARRNHKERAFLPPQPEGGRGRRAIPLSFVVDDATASTPPPFAASPRFPRRIRYRIYGREY